MRIFDTSARQIPRPFEWNGGSLFQCVYPPPRPLAEKASAWTGKEVAGKHTAAAEATEADQLKNPLILEKSAKNRVLRNALFRSLWEKKSIIKM